MSARNYGPKYDGSLTTTQIAAKFRADVKAAIKSGELPKGLKVSVRTNLYSMGSSIRVEVLAFSDPDVVQTLEQMLAAYNHDGSDTMTDLYDVKFHADVEAVAP